MRVRTGQVQVGPRLSCSILIPLVAKTTVRRRTGAGITRFQTRTCSRRMVLVQAERDDRQAERENGRLRGRSFCGMTSAGRRILVRTVSSGHLLLR